MRRKISNNFSLAVTASIVNSRSKWKIRAWLNYIKTNRLIFGKINIISLAAELSNKTSLEIMFEYRDQIGLSEDKRLCFLPLLELNRKSLIQECKENYSSDCIRELLP